jgi:hypothetical protein
MRFSLVVSISDKGIGFLPDPGTDTDAEAVFLPVATVSSTIVFHSPQKGHLPIHLELSFPQDLQNQTVFVFTVAIIHLYLTSKIRIFLNKKGASLHMEQCPLTFLSMITQPAGSLQLCCRKQRKAPQCNRLRSQRSYLSNHLLLPQLAVSYYCKHMKLQRT